MIAGATPVPLNAIVCGEVVELSLITSDALRVPDPPGVKVTVIVQLAPTGREEAQGGNGGGVDGSI